MRNQTQRIHDVVLHRTLVCDGAMGTQLMLAGLASGACGEDWNRDHPDRVLAIHRHYVDAGADCLITNTFGASRLMLRLHEAEGRVREINTAGAAIAREAFSGKPGFVLGDMGPLGALLEPYGDLTLEEAADAYSEQAAALVEGGVDAIIIETQTSLDELGLAIKAARAAGAPSVIASLAYDRTVDGRSYATIMGVRPGQAAVAAQQAGAHIIALNCGTGMDMVGTAAVTRLYREQTSLPIMCQPNAGLPVLQQGRLVYTQTPDEMAAGVTFALDAGASIIGSCCGSTPDHTRAIRSAVDRYLCR